MVQHLIFRPCRARAHAYGNAHHTPRIENPSILTMGTFAVKHSPPRRGQGRIGGSPGASRLRRSDIETEPDRFVDLIGSVYRPGVIGLSTESPR